MDRLWIGVALLVVLLAVSFWGGTAMVNFHEPLRENLEEASKVTMEGDPDRGIAIGYQAKARWEKHRHGVAAAADHAPMDEIDSLFAEMDSYATDRDFTHFAACCAQLASMMAAMEDAHMLAWWNLL